MCRRLKTCSAGSGALGCDGPGGAGERSRSSMFGMGGAGPKAAVVIGERARNDKRTWAVTRLVELHLPRLGFMIEENCG